MKIRHGIWSTCLKNYQNHGTIIRFQFLIRVSDQSSSSGNNSEISPSVSSTTSNIRRSIRSTNHIRNGNILQLSKIRFKSENNCHNQNVWKSKRWCQRPSLVLLLARLVTSLSLQSLHIWSGFWIAAKARGERRGNFWHASWWVDTSRCRSFLMRYILITCFNIITSIFLEATVPSPTPTTPTRIFSSQSWNLNGVVTCQLPLIALPIALKTNFFSIGGVVDNISVNFVCNSSRVSGHRMTAMLLVSCYSEC